jgi:exonuclease SbcD
VLAQLGQHDFGNPEPGFEPYLEVRVLLERPEPGLREAIEEVLNGRPVRLVRISPVTRPSRVSAADDASPGLELHLDAPDALFRRRYREQYGDEPSADLCGLFNEIQQQARREDGT